MLLVSPQVTRSTSSSAALAPENTSNQHHNPRVPPSQLEHSRVATDLQEQRSTQTEEHDRCRAGCVLGHATQPPRTHSHRDGPLPLPDDPAWPCIRHLPGLGAAAPTEWMSLRPYGRYRRRLHPTQPEAFRQTTIPGNHIVTVAACVLTRWVQRVPLTGATLDFTLRLGGAGVGRMC